MLQGLQMFQHSCYHVNFSPCVRPCIFSFLRFVFYINEQDQRVLKCVQIVLEAVIFFLQKLL